MASQNTEHDEVRSRLHHRTRVGGTQVGDGPKNYTQVGATRRGRMASIAMNPVLVHEDLGPEREFGTKMDQRSDGLT